MSNYDPRQGAPPAGYPPHQGGWDPNAVPAQAPQAPVDDGFILPDERLLRGQIDKANREGQARQQAAMPKYVKIDPPDGARSWNDVGPNGRASTYIWLCPAYAPGRELGFKYYSHFGRPDYAPQGHRIACGGRGCKICSVHYELRNRDKDLARELRRQTEDLYNVVHCSRDDTHRVKDGEGNESYRSALVAFGMDAHRMLLAILEIEGPRLCHPKLGRVLVYGRSRKSTDNRSFGYTLTQGPQKPLPEHWWDLCRPSHMWDLPATYPPSHPEEQHKWLEGMGLAPRQAQTQVPSGYGAGHAPSHGYPGQAAPRPQPGPQAAPQAASRPPQQHTYDQQPAHGGRPPDQGRQYSHPPAPPQAPARPPQAPASQPTFPYDAAPQGPAQPPAAAYGGGGSDHPYGGYSQPEEPPFSMGEAPPPKYPEPPAAPPQPPAQAPAPPPAPDYSAMPPPPPSYAAPQSSQAPPGAPPPPPTYAPVASGSRQGPPQPPAAPPAQQPLQQPASREHASYMRLTAPLPPNITLPGHRERCFGRHDPQSTLCAECPPWIKAQCQPQTPGFVPPGAQNSQVQQFADKMRGG